MFSILTGKDINTPLSRKKDLTKENVSFDENIKKPAEASGEGPWRNQPTSGISK